MTQSIIKVLPDAVANQIAAGEVVQRPSSAVKELLENAIDAGANDITLNIKDGGKALIQIIDNGKGMSEFDARLCIERHATSKIEKLDDIFKIRSMGFRGEAMASIAAVSQMEIKSRISSEEIGTSLVLKGSDVVSQDAAAADEGTTISVKNLFFNVPARRNFLKSKKVENKHILDVFQQVTLSHPDIRFSYYNDGNLILQLETGNTKQRILQLFGKRFDQRLIPIEEETEIVKISGFVGKPEFATVKRGEQFFFVNGRFIKSPYLHHAVKQAYEDLLPKDSHAPYFIFLEIDPAEIDINIHPTKTEIKFLEERSIYAILRTTIRQSLGKFNIAPSLDFERETAFDDLVIEKGRDIKIPEIKVDKQFDPFKSSDFLNESPEIQREKQLETQSTSDYGRESEKQFQETIFSSSIDEKDEEHNVQGKIFQLHNKYIVTQIRSGMMVINQHRAHQRVLFEKFMRNPDVNKASQQLLFPVLVELTPADRELVKEITSPLEKAGFSIEDFGGDSITLNGVPPECDESMVQDIFLGTLESFRLSGMKESDSSYEKIVRALASRLAIKPGQKLELPEMQNLIDELFACEMPHILPNGKTVITTMSLEELDKKFQ